MKKKASRKRNKSEKEYEVTVKILESEIKTWIESAVELDYEETDIDFQEAAEFIANKIMEKYKDQEFFTEEEDTEAFAEELGLTKKD